VPAPNWSGAGTALLGSAARTRRPLVERTVSQPSLWTYRPAPSSFRPQLASTVDVQAATEPVADTSPDSATFGAISLPATHPLHARLDAGPAMLADAA
jgi:hypothetical protein